MRLTAAELMAERGLNVVLAAEDWSDEYAKDPESHADLIKADSRLETIVRRYFKDMSERSNTFIDWAAYNLRLSQVQAADDFSVEVLLLDGPIGAEDQIFIESTIDQFARIITIGAVAGEKLYSYDLGLSQTSSQVQRAARELVAELVGMKLDKNGNIVVNPNAKFRISDKTRANIRESINQSLTLRENQQAAIERLRSVIRDPKRAATIARTETVNAYQEGLLAMGQESGAVGKEWQTVNAVDICASNQAQGIIGIKELFVSGHKKPTAHPNCRCGMRLIYPEDPDAKKL